MVINGYKCIVCFEMVLVDNNGYKEC